MSTGNTNSLVISPEQRAVLVALFDAFIPELSPEDTQRLVATCAEDTNHATQLEEYARRRGSIVVDAFIDMINNADVVPKEDAQNILTGLTIFSSAWGTFLLTGYFRPFPELTAQEQEIALKGLLTSSFETKRKVANGFRQVIMLLFFATVPPQSSHTGIDPLRRNVNWPAIQYPGPDPEASGPRFAQARTRFSRIHPTDLAALCNFQSVRDTSKSITPEPIRFDAIIIGSGPGGGATALHLAQAGYRVLILEAGKYSHPDDLTLLELETIQGMGMGGGALSTTDKSFAVIAGSTFGGGSAINWACSLDTPSAVRQEWCQKHGLPFFNSKGFSQCMEHVKQVMDVQEEGIIHNKSNQKLIYGSKQLGYPVRTAPQNAPKDHNCGWCNLGCKYGLKRGTNTSFIPLAVKYGAQVAVESRVTKILYSAKTSDDIKGLQKTLSGGEYIYPSTVPLPALNDTQLDIHTTGGEVSTHFFNKRAPSPYRPSVTGVRVAITTPTGRQQDVELHAPMVIVSGGTIQTPLLLKRSGLTNWNIGKNLHLHPACGIGAIYPEKIDNYVGSPLTSVCEAVKNQTPDGYGAIVEIASSHPGIGASAITWHSGYDLKRYMAQFSHMIPFISIVRDTASGSVSETPDGRPIIDYVMNDLDKKHLTEGIITAINVHVAAGAKEIIMPHFGIPSFIPDPNLGVVDQRLYDLFDLIRWHGIHPHGLMMFSAHQMSTARMSATKATGAIRSNGETYEVDNLFVADGSILPSAPGVNPMVTILSASQFVALNAAERLRLLTLLQQTSRSGLTSSTETTQLSAKSSGDRPIEVVESTLSGAAATAADTGAAAAGAETPTVATAENDIPARL